MRRVTTGAQIALLALLGCASDDRDVRAEEAPEARAREVARAPDACGGADPAALLDVGHSTRLSALTRSGERVLSVGGDRWVLWDVAQRRQLLRGDQPSGRFAWRFPPRLAGDTVLVAHPQASRTVEVRDARDARVLSTIDLGTAYAKLGLAMDGSYVWRADGQTLRVLTREGQLLLERAGDYANAALYAAPAALHAAARPDGTGELEILPVREGTAGRGPATGKAVQWFADGKHYLTPVGDDRAVYDLRGALLHTVTGVSPYLAQVGGYGDRVWHYEPASPERASSLHISNLGAASPLVSLQPHDRSVAVGSGGSVLGIFGGPEAVGDGVAGTLAQYDLRAAQPRALQSVFAQPITRYDSDARGDWAVGGERGFIQLGVAGSGTSTGALGCGAVLATATSPSGRVAIATDDGAVRIYDVTGAPALLITTLATHAADVALTADGKRVVTRGGLPVDSAFERSSDDASVRVFAVNGGALVHRFPHALRDRPTFMDFDLSATGRLARRLCTVGEATRACFVEVSDLKGDAAYRTEPVSWPAANEGFPPQLSPSGQRLALIVPREDRAWGESDTLLYEEGRLLRAIPGRSRGWLDDARLVVLTGTGERVVDLEGETVPDAALEDRGITGVVDADHYYWSSQIVRIHDGAVVWESQRIGIDAAIEAVAGDFVVLRAAERMYVARWR